MDAVLDSVNKMNTSAPISGEGEIAFFYNILVPDLLLFTIGISFSFGLLVYIF
jgi:hypothetical protein